MRLRGPEAWERYAAGAEAAEDLLAKLGVPVAKALNPTTRPGYEAAVRAMVRAIKRETHQADAKAIARAAARLDAKWGDLTPGELTKIIEAAQASILGVPPIVIPKVEKTLYDQTGKIIAATKAATGRELRIDTDFNSRDEAIAHFASKSQANYITDVYGKRAEAFGQRVRDTVASGIEQGLDNATIGEELRASMTDAMLRQSSAYWESLASIHTARARSWGTLASFNEAGISHFRWVSVLDQVTSIQCRFLHGHVFSVAKAVQRYQEVADSEEPEAVKDLQPWLRMGKTVSGAQFIYAQTGGSRQFVAHVEESGYGKLNERGAFSRAMKPEGLEGLGCTTPPAHPRCRSTLVPEDSPGASVSVPVAIAPPEKPARAPKPVKPLPPLVKPGEEDSLRTKAYEGLKDLQEKRTPKGRILPEAYGLTPATEEIAAKAAQLKADIDIKAIAPRLQHYRKDIEPGQIHAAAEGLDAKAIAREIRGDQFRRNSQPLLGEISPGKYVILNGEHQLLADRAVEGGARVEAYVIDMTKAKAQAAPLDLKTFRSSLSGAVETLEKDGGEKLRDVLRGVIANDGMWSRDVAMMQPGGGEVEFKEMAPGIGGFHEWTGAIRLKTEYLPALKDAARALSSGATYDSIGGTGIRALETLIHEELHGASPMTSHAYASSDYTRAIEEGGTEILARGTLRRLFGLTGELRFGDPLKLPEVTEGGHYSWGGPYDEYIVNLYTAARDGAGIPYADVPGHVEKALKTMRSNATRGGLHATSQAYEEAFYDAMELGDKRVAFVAKLKAEVDRDAKKKKK